MPNDPRVKFRSAKVCDKDIDYLRKHPEYLRDHPECRVVFSQHYAGGGGSSGRLRSIFEDGTPPDRPTDSGGGETGGGAATEIVQASLPIKPGLDPGGIAGITIASAIAIAAAAGLAEQERRRRMNRGIPLPQDNTVTQRSRPNLNRGGTRVPSSSRDSSSSSARGGIVPSSSGGDSSRSSSGSNSASISRSTSGTSTPYESASSGVRILSSINPDIRGRGQLGDIRISAPGIQTPAPIAIPAPNTFNRPREIELTTLEQQLVQKQSESQNPNISEGRSKRIQSEIRVLEREIEAIRAAMQTSLPAAAPAPEIQSIRDAMGTRLPTPPGGTEPPSPGPGPGGVNRTERTISLLEEVEAIYNLQLAKPARTQQELTERRKIRQKLEEVQSKLEYAKTYEQRNLINESITRGISTGKITSDRIPRNITPMTPAGNNPINDGFNAARQTNIEMQELTPQAHAQQTQAAAEATAEAMLADIDTLQADTVAEINRVRTPGGSRTPMVEFEVEIQELLKEAKATRGSRLFEKAMAGVNERIQRGKATLSELQKMGSRNKIQPTGSGSRTPETGRATLERARAAGRPMETEMRGSSLSARGASEALSARGASEALSATAPVTAEPASRSNAEYRQLLEGLPEDEILEMLRLREQLAKVTSDEMPAPVRDEVARPSAVERPPPAERPPPRPQEDFGAELQDAAGLTFRNKPLDRFNDMYDLMTERWRAYYSESVPTALEGMTEIQGKKYIMEQILKEQAANGDPIMAGDKNPIEVTLEEALAGVQTVYDRTDPPVSEEITTKKSLKPDKRRKLTKQTELLATEEQRLRPTALAGEARTRVLRERMAQRSQEITAGQQEINRLVESRAAAAPEMRAAAPEVSARSVPEPAVAAPEVTARRRLGVPELTAPTPAPGEAASFAERQAFFDRPVPPPPGEPAPSAPPSAPESGTATPSERPSMEQTPAERAAFAEELTGRLKKGPARAKAKINIGKPKATPNPLDIFVSPQHRNLPNTELNPSAKGFKGTLTEISSRVPRLVPTRSTLISMGAEGGSMVAGFAAGYFSAQAMNDYFAKHPAKNLGEQYGQALATTFVGMAVGSITQVVLSQVIRQGVNYALTGEVAAIGGAISGGGSLFLSSIGEAAIFTLVGVSTQMATTKFLEDAGFNHAISRSAGALASTGALAATEVGLWLAKGGLLNPAADVSFLASEAMIIGFGIYSFVTEFFEGAKEDENEEEYQAQLAENQRLNEERQQVIDSTIRRNSARQSFMMAYERADYDFDKALALLTPEQRIDLGQNAEATDPNGLVAFRAQVEAAFDPLLDTTLPEGYVNPTPLSREDQLKRDTYTAYVSWYIDSMNGKNPPPFDFNSEGAKLLNDESGGTWTSAANVHATTSMTMARRTNPLIENAQREIIDSFHKDHKTIEEMPYDIVQYADLDPGFRERYNLYIIAEAQSYIYQQYNNGGFTYNDIDPDLVAIANRDPEFRGAADFYYQTLANQARDYNLTIQECARLNALSATGQQVEIGKLNDARNKIIEQHQAANQEIVDRYNANILSQLNIYGDNFDAIIRNINDQALLSGHTFLYAGNRADLYRQLHMEMPELELVDPDTDTGTDEPDAPLPGPSKGRKIGDTDLYGYRYNLTDEQNQELDEKARLGGFSKSPTAMEAEAERIRYRDRYLFEDTDAEKAAKENLTLDEYYSKYGITAEQPIIEWEARLGVPKEDGRYRYPDGAIVTYKNRLRVDVDLTNVVAPPAITKYDPTLSFNQPDGEIEMPDGVVRTYKNGLVTQVAYPANTPASELLTPDQINAKERPTTPPTPPTPTGTEPTYEQLQQQYPETYKTLLRKYGDDNAQIEATLRKAYNNGFNETTGETSSGLTPGGQPVEPITREPTYQELKIMYPDKYTLFSSTYKSMHPQASQEIVDKQTELYLKQQYEKNPVPLPPPPTEPNRLPTLAELELMYPDELAAFQEETRKKYPGDEQMIEMRSESFLIKEYYKNPRPIPAPTPTQPTQPTQPTDPATLKQGDVTMPDGSKRTYKNGKVVYVSYPANAKRAIFAQEINEEEGIRNADWTPEAPVVTPVEPVVDRNTLLQGRVTAPDGSTRTYIDGKAVSVQYPEGKTGPNISQINASEGVQLATPRPAPAPAAAPAPAPAPAAAPVAPAPGNTTAQSLNLAVAPARAPATTYMPEDTTPGVAIP